MNQPEMLTVLSEIANSNHSGTGNSYYNQVCPRRAKLDIEYPEGKPAFELQVGLIFHKLQELWRSNQLHTVLLPENDNAETEKDPVAEALRLFKAYTSWFGTDGKPTDFELIAAEAPVRDVEEWGVPFTMRTDAVVVPLPGCAEKRGIILEPGVYLLDYKTSGAKQADQFVKDNMSTQFKAYIHVWNKNNPDCPVKGLIVDRIIRYKRDMMKLENGRPKGLESTVIAAPTDNEIEAIRRYYQWKSEFLKTNYCNLDACSYPRVCRHYATGACDRISK